MYVDEIFYGLQGEGNRMGFPSVFIRTGGCNLTCKGFGGQLQSPVNPDIMLLGCDTIHAVNRHHFQDTWTPYHSFNVLVNDVLKTIPNHLAYNEEKVDIVFTGGEPLLHHKTDVMVSSIKYFVSRGHRVWFETNGTIDINFEEFPIYKEVSFSISVKMSSSGENKEVRWKPNAVDNYLRNTKNSYFKFVLSKKSLIQESSEIFEYLELIPTYGTVYCMPLGENKEQLNENALDVYEFAAKNGLRYSDRLHIRIHNDKRGV